jgi:hypothetical protein
MSESGSTIITALFSGLFGAVITMIFTILFQRKREIKQEKLRLIKQLLGNRHDLRGERFTEALNTVAIVFCDSTKVKKALEEFFEVTTTVGASGTLRDQKLQTLFKAMCKNAGVDLEPLSDNFLLTAFNVRV